MLGKECLGIGDNSIREGTIIKQVYFLWVPYANIQYQFRLFVYKRTHISMGTLC